jgi:hypothetical protein
MNFWDFAKTLRAGDRVFVPFMLFWEHVGVVIGWFDGRPIIASLSDDGYQEQFLADFVEHASWRIERYNGHLNAQQLQYNARWWAAQRGYHYKDWNCEHFACVVQGRNPKSPQVANTGAFALAGVAALALASLSKA